MPTTRVITDVPLEQVAFVLSMIAFDGGTAQQEPEPDGQVTIIATFPDKADASVARAASRSPEAAWMKVARAEVGVTEDPLGSNPRIEAYHASTEGGAADDAVAWCASFVNFCVEAAGVRGTRSKAARAWLDWGVDAGDFVPGCIVVLRRGSPPQGACRLLRRLRVRAHQAAGGQPGQPGRRGLLRRRPGAGTAAGTAGQQLTGQGRCRGAGSAPASRFPGCPAPPPATSADAASRARRTRASRLLSS
jgi:uncharacterized protein (TIGR02594 family)